MYLFKYIIVRKDWISINEGGNTVTFFLWLMNKKEWLYSRLWVRWHIVELVWPRWGLPRFEYKRNPVLPRPKRKATA